MQPVRLGALVACLVANALTGMLAQPSRAQAALETPQQVNDRIRSLSASVRMTPHDYVIGSGDVLAIEVFDVKELSREVRVSQTGSIGIPLIPVRLHVAGLTEAQAEQKIAEVLEANGLVTHAEVSISIKEHKSKPITVVGAVPRPMVYQADRQVTLLEVLAEAGGISNDAGDTIIITRLAQEVQPDTVERPVIDPEQPHTAKELTDETGQNGTQSSSTAIPVSNETKTQMSAVPASSASGAVAGAANLAASSEPPSLPNTITIDLSALMETGDTVNNIVLQSGDIVTVPHAGIVYVLGAVNRTGGYVLANDRGQLTTLKILSLAGGLTRTAKSDKAVILRKDNQGQQHEIAIDLKKVLTRQAEDLKLQPSDILYVPDSATKQAMLRALEFGVALGTAVAIYRLAYQ